MLLPRVLLSSLERFGSTRNVQDVSSVANSLCEAEAERLESELAMIRYIAWAIPSVGFIGTVRGIGQALGASASRRRRRSIAGVTENLGIAFNSTFVALLISIVRDVSRASAAALAGAARLRYARPTSITI